MPPVGYRQAIIAALPSTRLDLPNKAHCTASTVQRWLTILHEADEIHIGAWKRSNGSGLIQKIWYAGPGPDAKLTLKPFTDRETCARYRRSIKGTEKGDLRNAKRRALYFVQKAAKSGDPLVNIVSVHRTQTKGGV